MALHDIVHPGEFCRPEARARMLIRLVSLVPLFSIVDDPDMRFSPRTPNVTAHGPPHASAQNMTFSRTASIEYKWLLAATWNKLVSTMNYERRTIRD